MFYDEEVDRNDDCCSYDNEGDNQDDPKDGTGKDRSFANR